MHECVWNVNEALKVHEKCKSKFSMTSITHPHPHKRFSSKKGENFQTMKNKRKILQTIFYPC
jgi:hypothetical protein